MRLAVAIFLAWTCAALAEAPPETDLNTPEHAWWENQRTPGGTSCCGSGDGRVLDDSEWRVRGGHYQFRTGKRWVEIPDDRVTSSRGVEPNEANRWRAKIWTSPDDPEHVYCFMAGAGT